MNNVYAVVECLSEITRLVLLSLSRRFPLLHMTLLCVRAEPGPRNELMARGLGWKALFGSLQFVLGFVGLFIVFYIPFSTSCGYASVASFAAIQVINWVNGWVNVWVHTDR